MSLHLALLPTVAAPRGPRPKAWKALTVPSTVSKKQPGRPGAYVAEGCNVRQPVGGWTPHASNKARRSGGRDWARLLTAC